MAAPHGAYVLACIKNLFIDCDYPETAYKRALGIIKLHRLYGSQRLDNACKRPFMPRLSLIGGSKNILENNLDKEIIEEPTGSASHIPPHDNIRGRKSYQ